VSYKLSILIPTIEKRKHLLKRLISELYDQDLTGVQLLPFLDDSLTIGEKRNWLLDASSGEYVCFIDDDDLVNKDYISTLMKGIETQPDCISLRGVMTTNGGNPEVFEHSIKYNAYKTTNNFIKYERYPNHLNCIKASIAKQFRFPSINHGEDTDWATQIHNSGLLKHEYYTDVMLYQYLYNTNK